MHSQKPQLFHFVIFSKVVLCFCCVALYIFAHVFTNLQKHNMLLILWSGKNIYFGVKMFVWLLEKKTVT